MQRSGADDFILATTEDVATGDALARTIPSGDTATLRWWMDVPASNKYIGAGGTTLSALGEANSYGPIGVSPDKTLSGAPTAVNGNGIQNWLLAEATAGAKSMLIIGDSIDAGLNETSAFTSDAYGDIGAANRWAALHGYNTINIAKPSSRASQWAAADWSVLLSLLDGIYFNAVWIGLGRNDYAASRTAAQIKADIETVISRIKTAVPTITRVIVRDLPPTTSSSDGWTTVEGQADRSGGAIGQEAVRAAHNAVVASVGITGQTDYFAFAPSCQATKSNGTVVWPALGTTDGIHPTGAVNAAAVAANNWD